MFLRTCADVSTRALNVLSKALGLESGAALIRGWVASFLLNPTGSEHDPLG